MSIANAQEANSMVDERIEAEQQRQEELTEAEKKRRKVEQSIREKTHTVYIDDDWRVKGTRITGEEEQWFREMNRKDEAGELTTEEDEAAEERINDILTEHIQSDWVTRDFIAGLPTMVRMTLFRDLITGGEEVAEAGNSHGQR